MKKIERIIQHYKGLHCFDVFLNDSTNNKLIKSGKIAFCLKSRRKMEIWVNTIQEFKHCNINKNHEGKVLVDFNKINEVADPLKTLYYDNTFKIRRKRIRKENKKQIDKTVTSIVKTIQKGNIAHNRVVRQYEGKLKTAKEFTHQVFLRQRRIKEMLEKRALFSKEKIDSYDKLKHRTRELRILKEVEDKIHKLKQQEIKKKH